MVPYILSMQAQLMDTVEKTNPIALRDYHMGRGIANHNIYTWSDKESYKVPKYHLY